MILPPLVFLGLSYHTVGDKEKSLITLTPRGAECIRKFGIGDGYTLKVWSCDVIGYFLWCHWFFLVMSLVASCDVIGCFLWRHWLLLVTSLVSYDIYGYFLWRHWLLLVTSLVSYDIYGYFLWRHRLLLKLLATYDVNGYIWRHCPHMMINQKIFELDQI
jgi:hypothetical protein